MSRLLNQPNETHSCLRIFLLGPIVLLSFSFRDTSKISFADERWDSLRRYLEYTKMRYRSFIIYLRNARYHLEAGAHNSGE